MLIPSVAETPLRTFAYEIQRLNSRKNSHRYRSAFWRNMLPVFAAILLVPVCHAASASERRPVTHIPSSAAIWFHPLPSASAWPGGNPVGGSVDFLELFQANPPWPRALAKTQVFGLYAGWIVDATDQELQQVVTFLNAHNMGIEIEAPALQALENCGTGVEGYVPFGQSLPQFTLAYLRRLRALNAPVRFIKVDEPFWFGSVTNDPRSCHFSVPQVASEVGQYAQLVKTVYPNAAVGDVEPIITALYQPNVVVAIQQWHATYQALTGAPFPFFVADTDFGNPIWPTLDKRLEAVTRQSGMAFGIIYIGDPQDVSDAEWSRKAVARFELYQGENGGRPDFVLFQSWEPHPQYCLPETDPASFTGVLDNYIQATD